VSIILNSSSKNQWTSESSKQGHIERVRKEVCPNHNTIYRQRNSMLGIRVLAQVLTTKIQDENKGTHRQ